MDILQRITQLREQRKWTIWKLAEESGVDQSTISAWYIKGRSPSISSVEKICTAFGVTVSQFFSVEETAVNITYEQRELLEKWAILNPQQKEIIFNLIKNMC